METILRGVGVSPGIAIGPALLFDAGRNEIPHFIVRNVRAEQDRLDVAIEATRKDLAELFRLTAQQIGEKHADIFNVHLMMLDDVVLRDEVHARISSEKINAEFLLDALSKKYSGLIAEIDDPRFRERTADLIDVTDRILNHLLEQKRPNLRELDKQCLVVARELSPSDTATMNLDMVLGLVLESGSVTSHAAILARALEIPAVMGLANVREKIENGARLAINGAEGMVVIDPTPKIQRQYRALRRRVLQDRATLEEAVATGLTTTLDNEVVPTQVNIELPIEIEHALKLTRDGIGLYRTEYLYLNRTSIPSEDEQYEAYLYAAEMVAPAPVTLRTMDIGGDKFVAHLQIFKEENPQLGWRAVRFCLARPDLFRAQLRAMLRASTVGNVRIMFPMISGLEEWRQVRAMFEDVRRELDRESVDFDHKLQVGSMIEVPAAVMITDLLAKECDFFSIGTNDLIQYSLAVDRINQRIAYLYEPAHPAVMRMIAKTAAAAKEAGIPCGICGEMAGDPLYTEVLLGLGVTSLSMSSISIPGIRAEISHTNLHQAKSLAKHVLQLGAAEEIKGVLRQRYKNRNAIKMFLRNLNEEGKE